jgi:hypothetical protein
VFVGRQVDKSAVALDALCGLADARLLESVLSTSYIE